MSEVDKCFSLCGTDPSSDYSDDEFHNYRAVVALGSGSVVNDDPLSQLAVSRVVNTVTYSWWAVAGVRSMVTARPQ